MNLFQRYIKYTSGGILLTILLFSSARSQTTNVSLWGRVIDEKTKEPLPGATVHIKGTTHEVLTDNTGEFKFITGQRVPLIYIVSYVGYQGREIPVSSYGHVLIELKGGNAALTEAVVVGYGTQRRSDVTGAVATVPKDILTRPASSFDNLLQGAVAGVVVNQSSGQPGATSTIRIRGGNSLSFGNDPLFVIDGFIYYNDNSLTNLAPNSGTVPSVTGVSSNGLSTINPSDIESIDVLKDASATAIYGSRGANGVVIWPFAGSTGPMGKQAAEVGFDEAALVVRVAAAPALGWVSAGLDDGRVWACDLAGQKIIPLKAEKGSPISALAMRADAGRVAWGDEDGNAGVAEVAP